MWDLIVSVPDHCLSFYFPSPICRQVYFYPSIPHCVPKHGRQVKAGTHGPLDHK